jgi:hypothetical protein
LLPSNAIMETNRNALQLSAKIIWKLAMSSGKIAFHLLSSD